MKISVALCTYNGALFIKKQLDSILNQIDFKIDEIIVCDDNSTDTTIDILNNYKEKYPTIFSIYKNETNLGSTKNFEKAITLCSGDYIFLSDQDDIWKENKVKTILSVFDKNPNAEGVFSNADIIDQNDKLVPNITIWDSIFFLEKELPKPIDFFNVISKNGNVVTGGTLCIKKIVKDFIFPFTDEVLHDEKIANILTLRESLFYSTENLISYRLHEKQQVGMKNIHKIKKKKRLKRIILDLEEPSSFNEHRHLSKKKYLKFKNSNKFRNSDHLKIDIQKLIKKSHNEFLEFNKILKSKFPFRYRFVKLSDKLLGKRK